MDTIRPKKLYSIALPESTTEKLINEYFYDMNGLFQGFHVTKERTDAKAGYKMFDTELINRNKPIQSATLMLRKRKSFNLLDESDMSSNNESSSNESSLNFGCTDDEDQSTKKRKH